MKKLAILTALVLQVACCTIAQIPTQFYLASDSCTFYLPDYTQAITVTDNCEVMNFIQTPTSGMKLAAGSDIIVTIRAEDFAGNVTSMQFDVVLIDEMPPKFHIPDSLLIPTGMWQNDVRTYHFYTYIPPDSSTMYHFHDSSPSPARTPD
jgi:hypothetical protein